jgi:hypothetical protein
MNKTFFFTLFKEGIGYESGLFRTIVDLYKNPQKVVEASINNDLTYVNPVKFMVNFIAVRIIKPIGLLFEIPMQHCVIRQN